jgi:flagellar FlgN protein
MSPEIVKLTEVLERKLKLLHELSEELTACRHAFVTMDLESIYLHIDAQTNTCEKLKRVEIERAAVWSALSTSRNEPANGGTLSSWIKSLDAEAGNRLRRVLTALAVAEGEIRHLNHSHSVLLDGTKRTLNILSNAMATLSPIYGPPRAWNTGQRPGQQP